MTFKDHVLGRSLKVSADLLALSAGMVAEDTEELASIVKLARTAEGHFMEAHVKLRPVDMATEGIFVCGTAHSPKLLHESISQAFAAASRATTFLSQPQLTLSAVTAQVEADLVRHVSSASGPVRIRCRESTKTVSVKSMWPYATDAVSVRRNVRPRPLN